MFNQLAEKFPRTFAPGAPKLEAFPIGGNNDSRAPNQSNVDEKSSLVPTRGNNNNNNSNNSGEMAEAMYHFQPSGPTDLPLYPGQRIQIVEKLNQDWWRGRDVQSNQEGIFPANYVRILSPSGPQSSAPPPSYGSSSYQYAPPPQQQQQYPPQSQQQFPPPSVGYYQQPPATQAPPQQVVVQQQQPEQQQQQQPQHHNAVADGAKKFGSKLGNAAIFGAGATIGSNIVNSIF